MSAWRRQAFELLPEFRKQLQDSESIYAYWIELQFAIGAAYRENNLDVFERILDYADWCLAQPEGKSAEDDLGTCLHFCFMEHLPGIDPNISLIQNKEPSGKELYEGADQLRVYDPIVRALHRELVERTSGKRK